MYYIGTRDYIQCTAGVDAMTMTFGGHLLYALYIYAGRYIHGHLLCGCFYTLFGVATNDDTTGPGRDHTCPIGSQGVLRAGNETPETNQVYSIKLL